MTIFEFLQELASFFPLDEKEDMIRKRISIYTEILKAEVTKSKSEYDFRKVIQWFLSNYKYKSFPNMATILEALPNGEISKISERCKDEGALLVVTLSSGYTYEFTVSHIGKSIDVLKASIKQKFGDCTYKFYPKGTVILDGKVYMEGKCGG